MFHCFTGGPAAVFIEGLVVRSLAAHEEVMFHFQALHFIEERLGYLPLDEVLR
jgi:hypothetical protein